ncbi:MAG: hypothetical protein CSA84_07595, partial [Actinomycetales bacterium]
MAAVSHKRPHYHHGDLASALLETAVSQVRARGAGQVSLRQLAQEVGVSPSAAYQHFPDKAALMMALSDWVFNELDAQMQAAIDAVTVDGPTGALARLGTLGHTYVRFAATEPNLFRHMSNTPRTTDLPDGSSTPEVTGETEPQSGAHRLVLEAIAEIDGYGLLRSDIGSDDGLDALAWSTVHGFATSQFRSADDCRVGQFPTSHRVRRPGTRRPLGNVRATRCIRSTVKNVTAGGTSEDAWRRVQRILITWTATVFASRKAAASASAVSSSGTVSPAVSPPDSARA